MDYKALKDSLPIRLQEWLLVINGKANVKMMFWHSKCFSVIPDLNCTITTKIMVSS